MPLIEVAFMTIDTIAVPDSCHHDTTAKIRSALVVREIKLGVRFEVLKHRIARSAV